MANISAAMEAKSDQLNYVDLGDTVTKIITIERVDFDPARAAQRMWIYFTGCNGKPYKPSLGMIRVMIAAWGDDDDNWIGKSLELAGDPTVMFGGKAVGGIVVKRLSGIQKDGISVYVAKNRKVRVKVDFPLLEIELSDNDRAWLEIVKNNPERLAEIEDPAYREKISNLMNEA